MAKKGSSTAGTRDCVPKEWIEQLEAVSFPLSAVPPAPVVTEFVRLYEVALSGYKKACETHQRRVAGRERFLEVSRREAVPAEILNTLKGPSFTFTNSDAESDARASEAWKVYSAHLDAARKAAAAYQGVCFDTQYRHSLASVASQERMEECSADLTQHASKILTEFEAPDVNRWSAYIEAVVRALGVRMEAIRLEVIAASVAAKNKVAREAAELAAAKAEAESKMDTRSVQDLVDERFAALGTSVLAVSSSTSPHPLSSFFFARQRTLRSGRACDRQERGRTAVQEEEEERFTSQPVPARRVLFEVERKRKRECFEEEGQVQGQECGREGRKRRRKTRQEGQRRRREREGEGEGVIEVVSPGVRLGRSSSYISIAAPPSLSSSISLSCTPLSCSSTSPSYSSVSFLPPSRARSRPLQSIPLSSLPVSLVYPSPSSSSSSSSLGSDSRSLLGRQNVVPEEGRYRAERFLIFSSSSPSH